MVSNWWIGLCAICLLVVLLLPKEIGGSVGLNYLNWWKSLCGDWRVWKEIGD